MSEQRIDQTLVTQVLSGDKEAFSILVMKYQSKINQLVLRYVSDPHAAKDIVQETFIKAYRSLDTFRGHSAFYTWLYRIAVNTAKNHNKIKGRRPPDTDIDYVDAEIHAHRYSLSESDDPEGLLQSDEVQSAVLDAVNMLPEDLRTSIILREMAGLSYDEIAKIMHCPVGTVRSRIFRARSAVDEHIKPYRN